MFTEKLKTDIAELRETISELKSEYSKLKWFQFIKKYQIRRKIEVGEDLLTEMIDTYAFVMEHWNEQ